jgi:hypothetical protein
MVLQMDRQQIATGNFQYGGAQPQIHAGSSDQGFHKT